MRNTKPKGYANINKRLAFFKLKKHSPKDFESNEIKLVL